MDDNIYTSSISSDFISHYGIKGMKWGIRRTAEELGHKVKSAFSRKDKGSSDSGAGSSNSSKIKGSITVKGTKKNPSTTRTSDGSSVEERKKKVLDSRSPKELYDNADLFTTKELQDAYNRLVLEKNIKNLSPKEVSKGQKMIDRYVNTADTIAKILNSTNKVASQVNRLKNIIESGSKKKDKENGSNKKNDSDRKNNSKSAKSETTSNSTKKTSNSDDAPKSETTSNSKKKTSNSDDAVEADSYEVPRNDRKKKASARETAKAARDFVYDVQEVYDSYTDPKNGRVQDGMDFAFELGDRFFDSNLRGLLGSGDDDNKKR